jgi:polar amino acid transport system substrate-binding protein
MLFNSFLRMIVRVLASALILTNVAYAASALPDTSAIYRPLSPDTLATVRLRGVLRIGVAPTAPMVQHDAGGKLTGYSIDLGNRLARDMGVTAQFIETSWPSLITGLQNGEYDLVASGLWVTSTRALVVNFSTPTASEGVYLVAGQKMSEKNKQADFDRADITIAVFANTPQSELAARLFPKARILAVDGDSDQLSPVLEGKAHAALVPAISPGALVGKSGGRLTLPLSKPLAVTHTAFAIRKGDGDFLNYLNTWLMLQRDSNWLDERLNRWGEAD